MRQCLFCDATKLTREHVWPNWIVKIFDAHVPDDMWGNTELLKADGTKTSWPIRFDYSQGEGCVWRLQQPLDE